jgi:aspartate racemase
MHVGLIGGIGPAATDFYYRRLIALSAASATPLELTTAHAELAALARNLTSGDKQSQAEIFLRLVRRLAAAGAQLAAVTSIGGHFCIDELMAMSPLPIVNAIPAIDAAVTSRNLKTVGLLGTRNAMETALYGGITAARVVVPESEAFAAVHASYVAMASAGRVTEAQRHTFFAIGRQLCDRGGAEAVLLGGTDLFLAFADQDCGFPVIDCAEIHADAIHRRSVKGESSPPGPKY